MSEHPWIQITPEQNYYVDFEDVITRNDGDACLALVTHLFLKNELTPPVCIDVGADIAWWSKFCKYIHPATKAFLFEPNPHSYEKIRDLPFNVYNMAVSDSSGQILMEFEGPTSNSRGNSGTYVNKTTLDFIFHEVDRVRMVKIDTEGHDLIVIKSLEKFFKRIDIIIFEFTCWWYGKDKNISIKKWC
jgi:FkbM family methyltransferase